MSSCVVRKKNPGCHCCFFFLIHAPSHYLLECIEEKRQIFPLRCEHLDCRCLSTKPSRNSKSATDLILLRMCVNTLPRGSLLGFSHQTTRYVMSSKRIGKISAPLCVTRRYASLSHFLRSRKASSGPLKQNCEVPIGVCLVDLWR